MESRFAYDVFLSCASSDKPIVRRLAERLKNDGLRVWFDDWSIHGKTSLVNMIDEILPDHRVAPITCESTDTFATMWSRVLRQIVLRYEVIGIGLRPMLETQTVTLSELMDQDDIRASEVAEALKSVPAPTVIVLDEFDRVTNQQAKAETRDLLLTSTADLLKNLSDNNLPVKVIPIGVGQNITSLIGSHPSCDRCLTGVEIPVMQEAEIKRSLETVVMNWGSRQTKKCWMKYRSWLWDFRTMRTCWDGV